MNSALARPGVVTSGTVMPGNKSDTELVNCPSERRQMRGAVAGLQTAFADPPAPVDPEPVLPEPPEPLGPVEGPEGRPFGSSPSVPVQPAEKTASSAHENRKFGAFTLDCPP